MTLLNHINDCIKVLGKQDVAYCKQQIINEAQKEINLIYANPYLSDGEKFYKANKVKQIADELLQIQNKRDCLLEASGFLNELSKTFERK